MTTMLNQCNTEGLEPYIPDDETPWDLRRAQHLFRRTSFGADIGTLIEALSRNPTDQVDAIIDSAAAQAPTPTPTWYNDTYPPNMIDTNKIIQEVLDYSVDFYQSLNNHGFREKMVLFWSNHFVTQIDSYLCSSYLHEYRKILEDFAIGDFKQMTREIGKCSAMLIYLNGVQNTRFSPNENYARELFELFTLGRDNGYTQSDISNTARALTGFNGFNQENLCEFISFIPAFHDTTSKTIFGESGNFNYDTLHDLLFEKRSNEIAQFVCSKIYEEFVSPEINMDIVSELAQTFIASNFNLLPVLRRLLKSKHFFSEHSIGAKIKSPISSIMGIVKDLNIPMNEERYLVAYQISTDIGQQLFNPPNVAGWTGNRDWVNSVTMVKRWEFFEFLFGFLFQDHSGHLQNFTKELTDNSNDVGFVSRSLVDYFLPKGFEKENDYQAALVAYKGDIPENYFEDGIWSLDWAPVPGLNLADAQAVSLLVYLSRLPEFLIY